jgi:uncharacterized RDD family membrane protein YckC
MVDLVIETSEGIRLRHEIAGAGSRAAAGILDLTISIFALLFLVTAVLMLGAVDPTGLSEFLLGLLAGGVFLYLIAYQVLFGIFGGGRTLGKRLLGLVVVDVQGIPATSRQHFLRGLFWLVEVILWVPIPLGMILVAITERRQRLGDMVGGTIVLRETTRLAGIEPFPRDQWSKLSERRLSLVPALAERFDGEDLSFLRNLLARRDLESRARKELLVKAAKHYGGALGLEMEREPRPREASAILRELYLFLRETRGAYSSSR